MNTGQLLAQTAVKMASNGDEYNARLWMAAEALFRREHGGHCRLISASRAVRGRYISLALLAVTALTDRSGQQRQMLQAAADYAAHRAGTLRHDPARFAQITAKER